MVADGNNCLPRDILPRFGFRLSSPSEVQTITFENMAELKTLFNSRALRSIGVLICLLLLLPSYSINNGTSHDWGGDFALYLQQAANLLEGNPQSESGYIYNPDCAILSPRSYPVGFPMLLAPAVALLGNDMAGLIDYMAVLFIAFGLILFLFFRKNLGVFMALIFTLGLCYHPALLSFKREIMSDIPFAALSLLTILLVDRKRWWLAIPVLILASVTRTIGVTLFVALGVLMIWHWTRRNQPTIKALLRSKEFMTLSAGVFGYLFLNHVVFATASESYGSVFGSEPILEGIRINLKFYSEFLRVFLFNEYAFMPIATGGLWMMVILATIGWIRRSVKKVGLAEVWLPIYLLVILVYPYRGAGLRFMLPVLPLLFFYAAYSFYNTHWAVKSTAIVLAFSPFLFNAERSFEFSRNWSENLFGPQSAASTQLFEHVTANTPEDAAILFVKPRVLAFYTGRRSMNSGRLQTVESIKTQLDTIPIQYLIHAKNMQNQGLMQLAETYPMEVDYEFVVYAYTKAGISE